MENKTNSLAALLAKNKPVVAQQQTPVVEEKKDAVPERKANPFAALANTLATANAPAPASVAATPAKPEIRIGSNIPTTAQPVSPAIHNNVSAAKPVPAKTAADITLDNIGDLQIEVAAPATGAIKYVHEGQPTEMGQKAIEELHVLIAELRDSFAGFDVQNSLRRVLNHMKGKAFLKEFLLPEDVALMVRGLRQSYVMVSNTKADNKQKRARKKSDDNDILNDLKDLDIQL